MSKKRVRADPAVAGRIIKRRKMFKNPRKAVVVITREIIFTLGLFDRKKFAAKTKNMVLMLIRTRRYVRISNQ